MEQKNQRTSVSNTTDKKEEKWKKAEGLTHYKKCPDCGIRMKYIYGEMFECPACGKHLLSDFGLVRQYLDEHGPQPAITISSATGVPVAEIDDYLREGRVEIPDGSPIYIKCQSCGTDIRYGRYCPECALKMTKAIGKAMYVGEMGEKPTRKAEMAGKMHLMNPLDEERKDKGLKRSHK